jgi:hypothetical protein
LSIFEICCCQNSNPKCGNKHFVSNKLSYGWVLDGSGGDMETSSNPLSTGLQELVISVGFSKEMATCATTVSLY